MGTPTDNKKTLSFGFFRKTETVQLSKSAVGDLEEKEDKTKDFVLSVEKNEVKTSKSDAKKKERKEFVIPLINQNRWRTGAEENGSDGGDKHVDLDIAAAKEIMKESAMLNDEWDNKGSFEDKNCAIPLLMQNKIPDGFETDNKLDVMLRPEEPNDADYDQIPIEHFGMAMLRGMGWSESRGVGKDGKVIAPIEAQARPKGLGLGADRRNKSENSSDHNKEKESSEKLILKKGSYCVIVAGANKDLYGMVEGIDEDNSRVMIKLALSGKMINLIQCNIKLVSKKDYEKFSKYINKQKADKYKEEEEKRRRDNENRIQNDSNSRGKKKKHKRHHEEELTNSDTQEGIQRKQNKKDFENSEERYSKHKKKYHTKEKEESYTSNKTKHRPEKYSEPVIEQDTFYTTNNERPWLQQDLCVRVIDKSFKNFYKEKVVIVDVPSPGICVCKSNDGKVLENISQSSVETVIPRDDSSFVLIVSGAHRGLFGQIMKRDKDKYLALVQLLSDRDTVLNLAYDEICEYVGDIQARDDY